MYLLSALHEPDTVLSTLNVLYNLILAPPLDAGEHNFELCFTN